MASLARRGLSAIEFQQFIFVNQLAGLALLAIAATGTWVIDSVFPGFFPYRYFAWGGFEAVLRFWPLVAWGMGLTLLLRLSGPARKAMQGKHNRQLLGWEILTSTLAGIWEELGYRWAFICYAMISIVALNWVLSSAIGWVLAVGFIIGAVALWREGEHESAIVLIVLAVLAALLAASDGPIYWFYRLLVLVTHYTTLAMMDPVLYGDHNELLVFGAIMANSWFRDGHKYQGLLGLVNSWYAGMTLLYAALMYGLWTAVAVHVIYDIAVSLLRFVLQKTR